MLEFNLNDARYYIVYSWLHHGIVDVEYDDRIFSRDLIYFSSRSKAREAIRYIGEQTLTKYLFGIYNKETGK